MRILPRRYPHEGVRPACRAAVTSLWVREYSAPTLPARVSVIPTSQLGLYHEPTVRMQPPMHHNPHESSWHLVYNVHIAAYGSVLGDPSECQDHLGSGE